MSNTIQFLNDQILFDGEQIAFDPNCCCEEVCPCTEYTDSDTSSVCCVMSITYAITLPDTLRWYKYTPNGFNDTTFHRMTITGWSALNGTHTASRVGGGGGDACDWATPADVTASISWTEEEAANLSSCPDASTSWTTVGSGTSTGFEFFSISGPSRELEVRVNSLINFQSWYVRYRADGGLKTYCGVKSLPAEQVPQDPITGTIDWDPEQRADFTGSVIVCQSEASLDDAVTEGFS